MAKQVFTGITPELLAVMSRQRQERIRLRMNEDGRSGQATGQLPFGPVEVDFVYARDLGELTVTVRRKPALVPAPLLWAEFSRAVRAARTTLEGTR